jgi:NTE family protein
VTGRHRAHSDEVAPGVRTAFVFQGGGSIAATQVGMLRALCDNGIQPDFVVGSSAGAINAVRFAMDPSSASIERLETLWTTVKRKDIFPLSARELTEALLGMGDGVASSKALRRFLERELVDTRLEELPLPVYVVATDFASGDPVTLSEGSTVTALLATTALPGVFPPVDIDGRHLIDGGIAADTPVLQADALGAKVSYVLPSIGPSDPESVPHGAAPVALRALSQLLGRASAGEVAAANHTVHVLPAPSLGNVNPFDFRNARHLIDEGDRLVRVWLHDHDPRVA